MDLNDTRRASSLTNEKRSIQQAMGLLSTGGRISAMTISGGVFRGEAARPPGMPPDLPLAGNIVSLPTEYINYPPQMVDAIQSALQVRLNEITAELQQLGVTGV